MDVIDANAEDVRFLQAARHGEVMTPVELIEGHLAVAAGLLLVLGVPVYFATRDLLKAKNAPAL